GARVSHFDDPDREARALASLDALATVAAAPLEQSDLGHCDVLVIAGASLVNEAPLAALGARQCARRGGKVFVISAHESYLADVATVVPTHPAAVGDALRAVTTALPASADGGALGAAAAALRGAQRPGLLLGSDLMDGDAFAAGVALAQAIRAAGKPLKFGTLFPGPNGFGAAAMS